MWNLKDLSAVQSINRMTWMFKNNCERRVSRLWVSFSSRKKQTNKQTNKHEIPPGVFGTKDCMIFLLKKKNGEKEKVEALEREKMSQSPIDFLSILIVIKNPLLQLMKSVVACLFRHQLSEILDTPSPDPCHLHPTPPSPYTSHNPLTPPTPHCPWITCTEISGSTMYSNLVWIMCCSLGFLKWYCSLYRTLALA